MTKIRNLLIVLCVSAISQAAWGHAEHDKARFVAQNGVDEGRCDNRFRPCKTISYAFNQANKGDSILVAQGQYAVTSSEELFLLSGQLVPVKGGYSLIDGYQVQSPDQHSTVLTGVPLAQAASLSKQGFSVIVDQKAQQMSTSAQSQAVALMQSKKAATACVDGNADGFACENISLVSHLPLSEFAGNPTGANDIWGHVDLNTGREYAVMGLVNGIAVIEVTDPENPEIIGQIQGARSGWRDVKVYQFYDTQQNIWKAYAYATAENDASEGLSIVDLSGLPQQISLVRRQQTDASAHNVYISNLDYSFNIALNDQQPLVHIVGANNFGGALRSYSVTDPEVLGATFTPQQATRLDYTHDASSLLINDARAQSNCNNAPGQACSVLLDFNENSLRIHDHTNINQAQLLGEGTYLNTAYTHSGWWSEDKQYVFLHDELDERDFAINTTVHVFNISDLSQPNQVGSWVGPTRAIDHNGFVRGNRYYMSNYTRGLTILDISDPTAPEQVGFFDTYPVSDNTAFFGAWGVYPFLPSGNILVSDINSGLFVLQDNTRDANNSINFSQASVNAEEGQSVTVQVVRSNEQSTQVDYEILLASASSNDFNDIQGGTLQWAAGDNSNRSISLDIAADNLDEVTETLYVRLTNPTNGSSLGQVNVSQINIRGNLTSAGIIRVIEPDLRVLENQGNAEIQIARDFGADGEISIHYELQSDSATAGEDIILTAGQLTWTDGNSQTQTLTLDVVDDEQIEGTESLNLLLSSDNPDVIGTNEISISIRDDESNQTPVVTTSADVEANTRQSRSISATVTDDNEAPLQFLWQQTAGAEVELSGETSSSISFVTPDSADTLTFVVTVTDEFGATAEATVNVNVLAPTTTPPPSSGSSGGGSAHSLLLLLAILINIRADAFFSKRKKASFRKCQASSH